MRISHLNGLKCQGRCEFSLGLPKFSNGHCDLILSHFFVILIPINILLMLTTKYQPNILSHFREMYLNALVDVIFFLGRCKFSNGHCDLFLLQIFSFMISINIKVLLILHTKFQPIPNILAVLEKMTILLVLIFLLMAASLKSQAD